MIKNTMVQITALFPGKHKMFLAGYFHGSNGFAAHQLNVIRSPRRREEREEYQKGHSAGRREEREAYYAVL